MAEERTPFESPAGGLPALLAELLAELPPSARRTLLSLYAREPQLGEDGAWHAIDATTRIKPSEGLELQRLIQLVSARSVLELGLGYGFSTQFLLAALQPKGGQLVSVDPFQASDWFGIGRRLAEATVATCSPSIPLDFRWIPERSDQAALQLEREGDRFDVIFIDGYHRFDDVLIDLSLTSRLCNPGGVIVLHDLWLPSVRAVVAFVEANRSDLVRMPCSCRNLAVFRLQGRDQRGWDHFQPFATEHEPWLEEA